MFCQQRHFGYLNILKTLIVVLHKKLHHVQDNPNLPDKSGEVPIPNGVVGNSISGHEIMYYQLDEKN